MYQSRALEAFVIALKGDCKLKLLTRSFVTFTVTTDPEAAPSLIKRWCCSLLLEQVLSLSLVLVAWIFVSKRPHAVLSVSAIGHRFGVTAPTGGGCRVPRRRGGRCTSPAMQYIGWLEVAESSSKYCQYSYYCLPP